MFEPALFFQLAFLAFALQWLMFIPSWIFHTEKYFDLTGSLTYITLALLAMFVLGNDDPRTILIGILVLIWAIRLGSFLYGRVSHAGEDRRFRKIKQNFALLLMVWSLQGAWVTVTFSAGLAAMTSNLYEPLGIFSASASIPARFAARSSALSSDVDVTLLLASLLLSSSRCRLIAGLVRSL